MNMTILHKPEHGNYIEAVLSLKEELVKGDYFSLHVFTDSSSDDAATHDRLLGSVDQADVLLIDRDSLWNLTGQIALQGAYEANIWSLGFTQNMHLFEAQRPPRLWAFCNYYLPERGIVVAEAIK